MSSPDIVKLRIPRQQLDHCSFFECNEKAVQLWLADLPMANLGETTRQLFKALSEFNQVRILPAMRMTVLEQLRHPIHYVSQALTKHYLNQPIVLPPQARKVADLAQALHLQLAIGYTIVATHTAALGKQVKISKPRQLIARALHRAITEHTLNMQRHYQLYEPASPGVWHNLHQFYCLARKHDILDVQVKDEEFDDSTVEGSYIRALLIGCAKPNQLRQEDFMGIFKPLAYWADMCRIVTVDMPGLFVIDLTQDRPAVYRELYHSVLEEHWISLDTSILALHLKRLNQNTDNSELKVKDGNHMISRDLLCHLTLAWSTMSKRTFMRMEANEDLHICIGLSATHHFVSGGISFESLVDERGAAALSLQDGNPFMRKPCEPTRHKDIWDSPYEANMGQANVSLENIDYHIRDHEHRTKEAGKEKYHRYNVHTINASAHGYCVQWPQDAIAHIKTGEIVGIKQHKGHHWSIGVIRWVSHNQSQQTQLGLELIGPGASPYAARVIHKKGAPADYIRVLLLPEIPAIKCPITLLAPRFPFRTGQKVVLNQRGKEVQVNLTQKLNNTGAYSQFEFHKTATKKPANDGSGTNTNDDNSEFDSLWGSL